MPGLVWKSVNGERRLVMRWKKRINGKLKITKEIYIGDIDRLADMIENPMKDMHVMSLDFGTTAFVRMVDGKIGLKHIVDNVMGHRGKGMSPGDYMLYCFSQFRTIHEKNYEIVPAVSPPFRSFIFLSLLNILALSIFDSLILRSSSGFPL